MPDDRQIQEIAVTAKRKIDGGKMFPADAVRAAIRDHEIEREERDDFFTSVMNELGRRDNSARPSEIRPPHRRF